MHRDAALLLIGFGSLKLPRDHFSLPVPHREMRPGSQIALAQGTQQGAADTAGMEPLLLWPGGLDSIHAELQLSLGSTDPQRALTCSCFDPSTCQASAMDLVSFDRTSCQSKVTIRGVSSG